LLFKAAFSLAKLHPYFSFDILLLTLLLESFDFELLNRMKFHIVAWKKEFFYFTEKNFMVERHFFINANKKQV